ncbi:urea carboxylase-associated protein 1 [Alicyclobacillus hesperidum URH17-3-68]|nr:urea carboxylase-associated protein 1 [Alicyclobacillus hesperidum URH17-3-68]
MQSVTNTLQDFEIDPGNLIFLDGIERVFIDAGTLHQIGNLPIAFKQEPIEMKLHFVHTNTSPF